MQAAFMMAVHLAATLLKALAGIGLGSAACFITDVAPTNDDGEGFALAILTAVALAVVEIAKSGRGTVDQISP